MAEEEKLNWRIILIQLIIAIAIVIVIAILGPQILYLGKEIGKYYNQQEYSIGILSIQLLQNMSIVQEEEILNQIYNEELNLVNNLTTNNG
jgi:predicted PurR-regulated permease PerM